MNYFHAREAEVSRYQLSEMEADALSHYSEAVTRELMTSLRGGLMLFENILSDLWHKGLRLRIVPRGVKLTDTPECQDLKRYATSDGNIYDLSNGVYRPLGLPHSPIIVVKEEKLISWHINQKYRTLVHEMAHAIWDLTLQNGERDYIIHLFSQEVRNPRSAEAAQSEYRMTNALDFFAEGFRYYITPCPKRQIHPFSGITEPGEDKPLAESIETLKVRNYKMFEFLDKKFGRIIDPDLVVAEQFLGEEECFDLWPSRGLYIPLTHDGPMVTRRVK